MRSHVISSGDKKPQELIRRLSRQLDAKHLLTNPAQLEAYAWDNTGIRTRPHCVVLAASTSQVAKVLKLCNELEIAVTPRGAGTGNVGGALAVGGGLVLSTQRMARILEISPADCLAVVEPGVVNADLQQALAEHGLFWPPDPSSSRICTIGGNIAMCAAGPGAVRYGVTRDWVLGLTAVMADGSIIKTGGRVTKGVVGYDLTRLIIGSEGSLAVVTEAILKLAPRPESRRLARAVFSTVEAASTAVSALMATGSPPSAIEFLDAACLELLRREGGLTIPEQGRAMLLLEISGSREETALQADTLNRIITAYKPLELTPSMDAAMAAQAWEARNALSPILKKLAPKRVNEDVVVPVSKLVDLITGIEKIALDLDLPIVNFGHAGNGNIHVNLLVDPDDATSMEKVKPALDRLFPLVIKLGGSLSGEHGVGTQKRDYVELELSRESLALQERIKKLFDPKGIMNPGKIFPKPEASWKISGS